MAKVFQILMGLMIIMSSIVVSMTIMAVVDHYNAPTPVVEVVEVIDVVDETTVDQPIEFMFADGSRGGLHYTTAYYVNPREYHADMGRGKIRELIVFPEILNAVKLYFSGVDRPVAPNALEMSEMRAYIEHYCVIRGVPVVIGSLSKTSRGGSGKS